MSWDEALFGAIYRLVRPARTAVPAHAAELTELRSRLRLLAIGLAGRPMEIFPADDAGGLIGTTLLLPPTMRFAPDRADNCMAYVVRVAIGACMQRLGLAPHAALIGTAADLHALLATRVVLQQLRIELPGLGAALTPLIPHVLGAAGAEPRGRRSGRFVSLLQQVLEGAEKLDAGTTEWLPEAGSVHALCGAELEAVARRRAGALAAERILPVVLWGTLRHASETAPRALATGRMPELGSTQREGKSRELVRRIALDEERQDENPLNHAFEKVHTAEEFAGGMKSVDGADDLDAHGDALDELTLRETVRSRQRTRSIYRADVQFDGPSGSDEAEPAGEIGIAYDEWDTRARGYRFGYCRLFEKTAPSARDVVAVASSVRAVLLENRAQIRRLEQQFARVERERRWKRRQADGSEIDIDAMVDRHAALVAGECGADQLYLAKRPEQPSLAVLLLLDMSLSSDAWICGARVLDIAREALLVLGAALGTLPVQTNISAFYSNTRRDCRFVRVKGFDEPWSLAHPRLARLVPTGYTRMGPALRHGICQLGEVDARRKLLLLLSDSKPTDFDQYEGPYGVGDVRQAVREGAAVGVRTQALVIDGAARSHLPSMFGPRGFSMVQGSADLSRELGRMLTERRG